MVNRRCSACGSEMEVREIKEPAWAHKRFTKDDPTLICPTCDSPSDDLEVSEDWKAKTHANDFVRSLECGICRTRWPKHDLFFVCPRCRERTKNVFHEPSLSVAEAIAQLPTLQFSWWLWEHPEGA